MHNGAAELTAVTRLVIEHLSKRRHEMQREAEEGGIGLTTKASAERAALATREREQYGLETHTWREESSPPPVIMTTAELISCERRLIASAIGRTSEGAGIVDPSLTERVLAGADRPLTAEQATAVRTIVSTGHGVNVIQALAGTGKTYTAGVLCQVYERAGYDVLGVAPTGRGVRELEQEAGIPSRTLDRLLLDLEHPGHELATGCVIILDEAGMAPTRHSARLLEAAEHAGAKVIAIGDPGQLASVQAGGWLAAVGLAVDVIRLTEVMRQRDPAERRALAALHDHQPHSYLQWASNAGRIQTFSDPATVCAQAIKEWASAAADLGPGQAVMIARDNDTRDTLNRTARELRLELGELGEQDSYGALELAVGDRAICRRNDRILDVDNGMRGTVRHLDSDRVVIDTDSGLLREISAAYAAEHLEHAYALTGHGMQGGTVETATVVASPYDLTAGWSYSALSRARGHTQLLIYENSYANERSEFAPTEQPPATSRDDLLDRVAQRMLERDDEDLAINHLPGAGRTDDDTLTDARRLNGLPVPERAAVRAETIAATVTTERSRELQDAIPQLRTQASALPTRQLKRIDDLDARAATLDTQREQLAQRLNHLAQPYRRFGRERDPNPIERAHLANALQAANRELDAVIKQRGRLERQLGNPSEARAEHDALQQTLTAITHEHRETHHNLAEREVQTPGAWAIRAFGERPTELHTRKQWEQAVCQAAHYRHLYDITDAATPLGSAPEDQQQRRDWQRTLTAISRTTRHRDLDVDITPTVEITQCG